MTQKQARQFNLMRAVLLRISKQYMTPDQMSRNHDKGRGMGPSYNEELEMAYENIQWDAARAVKGIKAIKIEPKPPHPQQPKP